MEDYQFSLAKVPAPHTVLKLPLRTYSIGHELLLGRINSPLLAGLPAENLDLQHAVLICAQTFEQATAINSDPLARLKIWIWNKRIQGVDYASEIQHFRNYVSLGSVGPKIKPSNSGRSPGAPWLLRLSHFLQFRLGKSESAAWNYPYGLAKYEWASYWESEGSIKIYNDQDFEFDCYCEEQDAIEAAELASKEAAKC